MAKSKDVYVVGEGNEPKKGRYILIQFEKDFKKFLSE